MLTRLRVRNFKRFDDIDIELGRTVVLIGPNNAGKSTALQALALWDIGFDQYYEAEQVGWVLYLESPSDLRIRRAFAGTLDHEAAKCLERPFVQYVATNLPQKARDHFYGLREAKSDLVSIALFDRLDKELRADGPLVELMWARREMGNYFCSDQVLLAYARHDLANDLFGSAERSKREQAMKAAIDEVSAALRTLDKADPWSADIKATDDFLEPVFRRYFETLQLLLKLRKLDYHVLAKFVPRESIDGEVGEKLSAILRVARCAKPRSD